MFTFSRKKRRAKREAKRAAKQAKKRAKLEAKLAKEDAKQGKLSTTTTETLNTVTGQPLDSTSAPIEKIPQFEEVFEVIRSVFDSDPMDGAFDVKVDETSLRSVSLALCQGLREHLSKSKSNPSDQDKGLRELGTYLERMNVYPVGFTQWTHSQAQGIAARVLFNGRNRTALIGPIHAMARATTKFPPKISELVESASARGNSAYVLGIDGLAYGAFEITHSLREING